MHNSKLKSSAFDKPSPPQAPQHIVGRPKEAKSDPLFCCGELHRSANYHKRTVHQKYTKIYFKHNPDASFLLKRNPTTCLFHCPQCDKSWAMATPVRNHIFQRCEGYVKYRASIPRSQGNATGDTQPAQVKDEDVPDPAPVVDGKAEDPAEDAPDRKGHAPPLPTKPNWDTETVAVNTSPVVRSPVRPTPDPVRHDNPTTTPKPLPPPSPSTASDSSLSPCQHGATVTAPLFPLLRPAQWSPVSVTNGLGMSVSASDSWSSTLSLPPSLTGGFPSRSSIFSVQTWPDDQPPGVPVPSPRLKMESDPHMIDSVSVSASAPVSVSAFASGSGSISGSGSGSRLPFGARIGHAMDLTRNRPPSAARVFLDGLRRPLGHAARHLHALGVVSEADLDLICTMPDAWDELGELLTRSGVTVIEWLMVKEAFKARAREVSAVM